MNWAFTILTTALCIASGSLELTTGGGFIAYALLSTGALQYATLLIEAWE